MSDQEKRKGSRTNGVERRGFTPAAPPTWRSSGLASHRPAFPHPRAPHRIPIPRSQRWLFWIMLLLVIAMSVYLIRLRERAGDRFAAAAQPLPLSAADTHQEPLRLYLANDTDGSLAEKPIRFPLPADPNARARVVLEKLIAEYAAPGSLHPLHIATGVEEVYLLPVPGLRAGPGRNQPQLAVVNLTTAFVQNHPSGIEPETLTLLSMIATLRANLPSVAEVRFVVDGEQQATLAGHADLTRTYLAAGTQMTTGALTGDASGSELNEKGSQP
jgi:hypothetical protein